MYGHALLRLIHYIVACRRKFPNKKILLSKFDLKSAYRRCHMNYDTAIQFVTMDPELDIAMLTLRLTFGGAPNPNKFSLVSESIFDLANHLLQNDKWIHEKYFSHIQDKIPAITTLSDDLPFADAHPLIVDVPCDPRGHAEIYIDDFIVTCVDIGNNTIRANKAVSLAIHVVERPLLPLELIPRKDFISEEKLAAKADQSEIKRNLGWNINTIYLIIALPDDNATSWTNTIKIIIRNKKSTHDELETILGRVTHLAVPSPKILHFLSRPRALVKRAETRREIGITPQVIYDLQLFVKFISNANKGINLNLCTFRCPTIVYRADACPQGIGGFSHRGRAWRFKIPVHLQFRATLNFLEFITSTVGI